MVGMTSSPAIVLLHGQPDSSASFLGLRAALQHRMPGTRVLVPDRPGYGANRLAARDFGGNVDWLRGWLEHNVEGPAVVLGHSWAGGVAILAASRHPDLVSRLVLLSSIGPSCLQWIDPVLGAPVLGEVIAYGGLQLGKPFISRRAGSLIINRQPADDRPYARASGMAMRSRPVWRSFLVEQRALLTKLPDIEAALPTVARPTLVIRGEQDRLIPAETPAALAERIPRAQAVALSGAHDLQLRQPKQVADAVAAFVAEPA